MAWLLQYCTFHHFCSCCLCVTAHLTFFLMQLLFLFLCSYLSLCLPPSISCVSSRVAGGHVPAGPIAPGRRSLPSDLQRHAYLHHFLLAHSRHVHYGEETPGSVYYSLQSSLCPLLARPFFRTAHSHAVLLEDSN